MPRDDREWESRRQQIMEGALHVFARKGFEKATNRDIAAAAGIGSPGLIYHYFKDKRDLFQQMVEARVPALQFILHGDEMLDWPPRELLTQLGEAFLATMGDRTNVAVFRLIAGEALRHPTVADMLNAIGPLRGIAFLRRYLEHHMEQGTLRRTDPGAAARCFMGPLLAYVLTTEIFPQPDAQTLSRETMVATAVEVFLQGMEVKDEG